MTSLSIPAPANMGFCDRKIVNGSDLVGLSILASRFSEQEARTGSQKLRYSTCGYIHHRRCRKYRRRLHLRSIDQTRLVDQSQSQDRNADLCSRGDPDSLCIGHVEPLGIRYSDRYRGGGSSGMVGEHIHDLVRHVPETSCRFGGRYRRNARCGWRYDHLAYRRIYFADDGKLRSDLYHGRFGLSRRIAYNSSTRTETRACCDQI